jgi:hyperosmotically inducible periplasmic protein
MRVNNKVFFLMVMFILAAFLGNIQGVCLAQPADNTKINKRDVSATELTADQQGQTEEDIEITQKIRQAVVNNESLSINAQNVKIITIDRVVTLKGPVKSEEEKMAIEEKAAQIAGKENVRNEIDIAH